MIILISNMVIFEYSKYIKVVYEWLQNQPSIAIYT